jgi:hypothetical protein
MHKTYAEEAMFFVLNANVFCSISVHKAAGPDNIPNWVLKGFAHILALPVSMLTNVSFKKEQLPLIWKCANIIIIIWGFGGQVVSALAFHL